jgi:uncharacterized membrane protein
MYKKDSTTVSVLWGRSGAAILLLVSMVLGGFGFTFAEDDQAAIFEAVSTLLAAIALIQVRLSKIRESKKLEEK